MKPEDKEKFLSHLASLHAHLQKELKLKSKPKVFLVSDQKNADKVLGKTAHYEPETKTIRLNITDRHPKDILRSYSHEVVHHWQHEHKNLEGKRGENTGPRYAQKDPWLRQMEKQAYLLGNILFRDWEDGKKADDKKTGKKVNESLRKGVAKIIPANNGFYIDDPYNDFGYPILASALREASRKGYTHFELNGKVREIPRQYRAIQEKTQVIGTEYPPKVRGPEYKDTSYGKSSV